MEFSVLQFVHITSGPVTERSWVEWLWLLYSPSSAVFKCWYICIWAFFEQPKLSAFLYTAQSLNHPCGPLLKSLQYIHVLSCTREPNTTSRIQNPNVSPQVRTVGNDQSSWLQGFVVNLSIRTFRSFSAKLISRQSTSSMDWCLHWGYFFPRKGLCVSLSWTSWCTSLSIPPVCPDASEWQHSCLPINHSSQFCIILWNMHDVPASGSLMRVMNSICASNGDNASDWPGAGLHTAAGPFQPSISASFQPISLSTYVSPAPSVCLWGY